MVPRPKSPTQTHIADEATSTCVDVRYRGAATTVIGLEAEQGSGNIDKTLTMPQDSPLPRVNKLGSDEGNMTLQELMVLCTTLSKKKVKKLENKVKSNQARRRARIIVSDDEEDLEDPSKQGRKISEIDQDPTISLDVSTAEDDISTAKPASTAAAAVTTTSVDVSTVTVSTAKDKDDRFMELAGRLQAQEQEELNVEEKSKLFVELMDKRQNILQDLEQKSRKENPTKASEGEIYASSLVYMDSEVVERRVKEKDEGSVTRAEESNSKKAGQGTKLEQERIKKQKIDDDQEEVEMKKHMEIIVDEEEIAVDAIPLATKPLIIDIQRGDSLEAIFFKWSTFCEISESAYLYAGREKVSTYICNNHSNAQQEASTNHWNEMCYQLLKLMTKQGSIVGIKRLHDDLGVNTAKMIKTRFLLINGFNEVLPPRYAVEGENKSRHRRSKLEYKYHDSKTKTSSSALEAPWMSFIMLYLYLLGKLEGNRHLHADREGVSIVKRNSYTDADCKALGGTR
ncbi:hypothetical protein Tco_0848855 [Tanacetum coccineum]